MKKILAILLAAILLAASAETYFANALNSDTETRIAAGSLKDVSYAAGDGYEKISLKLYKYADYSVMRLTGPDRIVIDVYNAAVTGRSRTINTAGRLVKSVRYGQFDTYTTRIVLDVDGQPEYNIEKTADGLDVFVGDAPADNGMDTGSGTTVTPSPEKVENNAEKKRVTIHKYFTIDYLPTETNDEITINLKNYKGYKVVRLTGPDRLQIDIPKAKYKGKSQTVAIGSPFINTLRYSVQGSDTARIVLNLTGQNQYVVKESAGKLTVSFKKASYKNIRYSNNGDRVYFTLAGAILTDGGEKLKKYYTGSYDKSGLFYTMTFSGNQAGIGTGVFRVNDDYVDYVSILQDASGKKTSIKIKAKKKFFYEVFTRDKTNGTTITLLDPAKAGEKLVVIDAGHGGSAPGAIYKGVVEKDLNLDIAVRLNTLLKKKGVKTYMIRNDDSFVGNFERAYIANDLKASLFISIHNNTLDDPSYSGTMTLYYPRWDSGKGITGRSFAELIHDRLLARLHTVDRGTVERPNLVVLNATAMPSALAEVAFMTNAGNRSSLLKESFRQKAAQGLCDGVAEALKRVGR